MDRSKRSYVLFWDPKAHSDFLVMHRLQATWQVDVWMGLASVVPSIQSADVNLASAWCYHRRQSRSALPGDDGTSGAEYFIYFPPHFPLHSVDPVCWKFPFFLHLHLISSFPPALLRSPARFSGERLCPSSLLVLPLRSHLVRSGLHYSTSHRHHHHMCNFWHSPVNSHFG